MGVMYDGAYAEVLGHDAHEGCAAGVLPDGSATAMWSAQAAEYLARVAVCSCGWTGEVRYPPTEDGADDAIAEWESDHLQPLIAHAAASWPVWTEQVSARAAAIARHVGDGRPDRALLVAERLVADVQSRLRIVERLVEEKSAADTASSDVRFEGVGS